MALEIIRNDITKVSADAIVNTANPRPRIGAGTDTAIHKAAGPELLEARKKIGDIRPGEVAVTPAFKLDAKYVIHAVGPAWQGGDAHEEETLRSAYDHALQAAVDNGCESVAFPLMAAGSYGFPKELAMSVAIRAFTDFLLEHDIQIILVVFNKSIYELSGHLFDDVQAFVDENYVDAAHNEEYYYKNDLPYDEREYRNRRRMEELYDRRRWQDQEDMVCGSAEIVETEAAAVVDSWDLDDMLSTSNETFYQMLFRLIDERDWKDSRVYRAAAISKQQFSKIRCTTDYQPTKSAALRFALALELDYDTAQQFLATAGYTLSRSNATDTIVEHHIRTKNYNLVRVEINLARFQLPPLTPPTRKEKE